MSESTIVTDHTVAVYATHSQAEDAVKLLQHSGFKMTNLSIIGKNYEMDEHPVGFVNAGDRMWTWGKFGAFWGSIWGLLFGSAMVFIPAVGFVVVAGWIVAALGGAIIGGGVAALGGALASIGIPENSVLDYQTELKAGSFLLLAHGTSEEIQHAKETLNSTGATRIDDYSIKVTEPQLVL